MNITYYKVIYTKLFNLKEQAERFIQSHKKQDCFSLSYIESLHQWKVAKTKQIDPII